MKSSSSNWLVSVLAILIVAIGIGVYFFVSHNPLSKGENAITGLGSNGAVPRLTIKGSQIYDPYGNPITLRGFVWGDWGTPQPQDAADNISQGANYVRIPLSWYFGSGTGATDCGTGQDSYDPSQPGNINPANLAILDKEVQWASAAHLWVDLMVRGGDCDFWTNPKIIPEYIQMWQFLAYRYKDTPYIGSYEVLSEPHPGHPSQDGTAHNDEVKTLLESTISAIRAIDPRTPIAVGPAKDYELRNLEQIYMPNETNLIYTFNFFDLAAYVKPGKGEDAGGYPGNYPDTGNSSNSCEYPGKGQTVYMDKAWLGTLLTDCVLSFRTAHAVPVYADQVGPQTQVPDGQQYVTDVLGLFDQDGINWTYWTYRAKGANNDDTSQAMIYEDTSGVWHTKTDWLSLVSSFFKQ